MDTVRVVGILISWEETMSENTCEGCPYYTHWDNGWDNGGYSYRTYYHQCWIDPVPIMRKEGNGSEAPEAPVACGRKPKAEQQ
jgi:hypothetical protein